jgi:uncharacterized protein DUF4352
MRTTPLQLAAGAMLAAAALAGCAPVAETSEPGSSQGAKASQSTKAKPKRAGLNQPVKDGKFTFTVTRVTTRAGRIGDQYLGTDPQGKWVFVHVTVANHSDKPQTFFGDAQKLFAGSKEFSADTEAAAYLDSSKSLYEEINPGNKVKGVVIFDVPKQVKPTALRLHDSVFSGGVRVTLT